jgi:hypothetical protein
MNAATKRAYKRRLAILEEQAAYHGIDTSPDIIMEIEDIKRLLKNDRA